MEKKGWCTYNGQFYCTAYPEVYTPSLFCFDTVSTILQQYPQYTYDHKYIDITLTDAYVPKEATSD